VHNIFTPEIVLKDIKWTCFTNGDGILVILDVKIESEFPPTSITLERSLDQGQYFAKPYLVPLKKKISIVDVCSHLFSDVDYKILVGNATGTYSSGPIHVDLQQGILMNFNTRYVNPIHMGYD
jgi:hypothetical protein